MANRKISELAPLTVDIDGTEILPLVQGGTTKRPTVDQFLTIPGADGKVDRGMKEKLADALDVKDYGVTGDGSADETVSMSLAFSRAALLGKKIRVPAGQYRITNTVTWTITGDFDVECDPNAVFVAASGFPVDQKMFMPSAPSGQCRFSWIGGVIDGRNMPARLSGAPDLLYISSQHLSFVEVSGVTFICNNDRSGTAGDSCLFLAEGEDYKVTNCVFQGATDSAIYISGSNDELFGKRCYVSGNTFLECMVGVISKRGFEDHIVADNFINGVDNGIVIGGIGDTGTTGRKATITGNEIRRCGRGIEARIADGTVIVGNRIEDWGMNSAGAAVEGYGIRVAGSKGCVVSGNVLRYSGAIVSNANSAGIILERRTELSVNHESTNNLVSVNAIHGCGRGIVETTGSDQNQITHNLMTSIAGARITLVGAATTYIDHDTISRRIHTRLGASGGSPISGSNTVIESNGDLIESRLVPSTNAYILMMGDSASNSVGRMAYDHTTDRWTWRAGGGGVNLSLGNLTMGFYGTTPVAKPTVTGAKGGNAALTSLLTQLAGLGLLTDSTT